MRFVCITHGLIFVLNTVPGIPAVKVSCPASHTKQDDQQAPDQVSHGFFLLKFENL